jgi:DNA polymerase III delta subunit
MYCPGLDSKLIDYFYNCTKGDLYRIENELDKIKLFDIDKRNNVLTALLKEENTDLVIEVNAFEFCDYLTEGNIEAIRRSLYIRDYCDFQATFLVSILISKFKTLAGCLETNLCANDLGLSVGQYKYIKYIKYKQTKKPNSKFIEKSLKFLTEIDYKLKTGKLDINEKQKQDLIICRILSFYLNK